jgi:hypothetical protein
MPSVPDLMLPPLPSLAAHADELAAESPVGRDGVLPTVPDGHTLVVATARHRFRDAARGLDVVVFPGQAYAMPDARVAPNVAAGLIVVPEHIALEWYAPAGRVLVVEPGDAVPYAHAPAPTALKIASGCGYDPGSAAFRLHSAVNETTQHASVFVRWGDSNPHCSLRQFDGITDAYVVRQAVEQADVLHNHVAYFLLNNTGVPHRSWQLLVRHYHGSRPDGGTNLEPQWDTAKGAALFGARLQLCEEGRRKGLTLRWSPIPMPTARYAALAQAEREAAHWTPLDGPATAARPLVVAHSPTNLAIKGTDAVKRAVDTLQQRGVPIVLDCITGVSLASALKRKALADVCFDSFWLGMQGSGLEAASMGLAVIAGDHEAAALTADVNGGVVPWTFANDEAALTRTLERFAMDAAARQDAADTVGRFTRAVHDYAAVAARYEADLSDLLGRDVRTTAPVLAAPVPARQRGKSRKVAA